MIVALFKVIQYRRKVCIFEEISSFIQLSIKLVLDMLFLILINVDVNFLNLKFVQGIQIFIKVILTIKKFQLIRQKKFVVTAFKLEKETYVVYIANIAIF